MTKDLAFYRESSFDTSCQGVLINVPVHIDETVVLNKFLEVFNSDPGVEYTWWQVTKPKEMFEDHLIVDWA